MADDKKPKPPCQKEACKLQDCLWRNDFQESRCQETLRALQSCCNTLLQANKTSICCPSKPMKKL
ncbi:DUF1903-domain-containing protein [Kickxella alabastrina]|uniref:DUF1903-domain-containing protein n=1 Tax=Kickxella alabastrina TaxID=61397 RepID=UPI00222111B3|nr:DUF1903-domain-containing protein [Kickxella alabastrina]KAI7829083.1 DUF1903-domain-containing protein [Kickxella alabastrina]